MSGRNWVILVAGTKDWDNYRDQANVCSAYQIIKKHGIPPEQIVVMMYDDIAYDSNNPYKGKVVNVLDNSNVYPSVPKDYTKEKVTSKAFLDVLQGNATAGGKVIKSGNQDNIFIYMSGTGTGNTLDFPKKPLVVSDFIKAIESMHNQKKFSEMVIYVESTNSSSLFSGLSDTTNAYAVTSGGSTPCNKNDKLGVYLSDDFSAALLDIFSNTDYKASRFQNLNDFINKNAQVYVNEFGDKTISTSSLSKFLDK